MATKKQQLQQNKAFQNVMKELSKKYGDSPISFLTDSYETKVETISTGSIILDSIIGGGLAKGRLIEIYGPEASGKTSIALTAIANAQKEGATAVFLDVEQAFDPVYAKNLGVNLETLGFAQPSVAEDTLQLVQDLIVSGEVDIIVVDSVAAMIPRAEIEQDFEKSTIGLLARLMSKALKQLAKKANQHKCTVIFLNQIRDKVGIGAMYGPSFDTTGGRALKFAASQRIEVRRKSKVEDEKKNVIGTEVVLKCIKNKIAPPYGEGKTVLTFKEGINQAAELLLLGEELGVIKKEGRTYFTDAPPEKYSIDGGTATIHTDGRIKIGVNSKPVLNEIKMNTKIFNLLSERVVEAVKSSQGLSDISVSREDQEIQEMEIEEDEE